MDMVNKSLDRRRRAGARMRAAATTASLVLVAATLEAGTTYYVSPTGNDGNAGTTTSAPFRTIQRGVHALAAGDVLELRSGDYVGDVQIVGKHGTPSQPIVIRSYKGERARIDSYLPTLVTVPGGAQPAWEPASIDDPQAHPEEFVSTRTFSEESVNRGAFLELGAHTRLVTYSRVEDLRALHETFAPIPASVLDDPRPGPAVFVPCAAGDGNPACQALPDCAPYPACAPTPARRYKPAGFRLPWVYMGPGLWFNETSRKVHVRLSPTHNHIAGLRDYQGETDPRKVALAVASRHMKALRIVGSSHVVISNVDVRFGGDQTIWLENTQDIVFDHVNVWAGTRGMRLLSADRTVFRHGYVDGGVPEWFFRGDSKDAYVFLRDGQIVPNGLASQTVDTLMAGSAADEGTLIEHSEFVNGHDLYLAGTNVRFHHNWVSNLNDDCLFLDAPGYGVSGARVHENVFERCLAAIVMAGEEVGGPRYIYRNLIDLRLPTAGFRPRDAIDRDVWRYGQPFKSRLPDGPLDVFHNTFLVNPQEATQASLLHYRHTAIGESPRRTFNNIFLVNQHVAADQSIAFLPDPSFHGPTDGNDYVRLGRFTAAPFRIAGYCRPAPCSPSSPPTVLARTFQNLADLRASAYFQHSTAVYPPGFEAHGLDVDPQFLSFAADGAVATTDDVRLSAASPLRDAGIALPPDLAALDPQAGTAGARDIGCCPYASAPLQTGVDGRRRFPRHP